MREELAALMHEMWAGWMEHVFLQCAQERIEGKGSEIVIPEHWAKRWSRQIDTLYDGLSEEEKDSDRREADKVLALITARFVAEFEKPWGYGNNDATAQSPVVVIGQDSTVIEEIV